MARTPVALRELIREIPDFPRPGIGFKDITPLLADADALAHGARVLIHDDLLATGGTARALAELVERLGATVVGCAFLVELGFLDGRRRLEGFDVHALVTYESD